MRAAMLGILALSICWVAAAEAGSLTAQSALVDRRVPYYVLPGCDYMLDAGQRCDISEFSPAVGCCPMGHECGAQQGQGQDKVSVCVPGPPTYDMSPDCILRALPNKDCSEDACCPDGFDCVASPSNRTSTCTWTGRPIVPPTGYVTSTKQKTPKGKQAANKPVQPDALVKATSGHSGRGTGGRRLHQASCAGQTGFLCADTTLVQAGQPFCNTPGKRWQAPSCKCYDTPSTDAMTNTPPALDINADGQWVVRETGLPASIQGINWFGFNNGQTMVDGLWAGYQNATLGDFPTVLKRIKLLGFNGLRLPFTFVDLDKAPTKALYVTGVKTDTIAQFRQSLTPTYTTVSPTPNTDIAQAYLSSTSCPFDTNPTESTQGTLSVSNKHVPGRQDTTTWNRFFWVIQYAVGQGFYVTIDFHFEQSGLQNNPTLFASEWRRLWTDMVALPTYSSKLEGRVFPELANEWDKFGCRWDTAGGRSCSAPYKTSIEAAAAAIRDASVAAGVPAPLMLINGVGQTAYGFNWGDGFITDGTKISQFRLSDPRGFFTADNAANRNYKIVLAPHTYGPTVTGQTDAQTSGNTLWERLFASWGSKSPAADLNAVGIQQDYGVAVTEFGSDCDLYNGLTSRLCAGKDARYLQDLAAYLNNSATIPTQFGPKNKNTVWFWWSWNANSGDTAGLVSGARPGPWYTVKWYKVRYLEGLGLCPWYKTSCT